MKFLKIVTALVALWSFPASAEETADREAPALTEVMVLGVYHFANPGQDMVNMEVDDVLAPGRQREMQALVDALAEWKPTRIAVENMAEAPTLTMDDYAETDALLATDRNESIQIGYRLAKQLGHDAVYGYDEQPGDGEPDYFPMGKVQAFAAENGQMDVLEQLIAEVRASTVEEQRDLPNQTIAESLLAHNDRARIDGRHDRLYYSLLQIGDGDAQPGAELNAYWYMRNAKMFAKVDMIARPGDRVLVIAGSGHATWLKHFAERMPGYTLVEALPYLEMASSKPE